MDLTKPPFKRTMTMYERQLKERGLKYFMGSNTFINDRTYHDCERCLHVSSGWGDLAKCSLDDWHYCIHHQKPYFRDRDKCPSQPPEATYIPHSENPTCDTCLLKDARQFIKYRSFLGCPMCRENGYPKYIPISKSKDPHIQRRYEQGGAWYKKDQQDIPFLKDNEFEV